MPEWHDVDEIQLLKAAQDGDVQAFGRLYEHYAPLVFRFLYARLDDRLDAEDMTEEVFIKVWQALPGYRHQGIPFAGYLFRVARNALTDFYRRSRRRRPPLPLIAERLQAEDANPAETVPASLERARVRRVLEQLKEDYRTVLVLRFYADLSPDEVAAVLGKSPGAIRVMQHRALAALRERMDLELS